mgnify:CR=1 FL=1
MLSLGVLHTSHYRLHKKAGIFFLILMYPRPCRAKNGVFSTASSAGAAAQIYGKNMARIRGMDQLARAAGRLIQNEIRELGD